MLVVEAEGCQSWRQSVGVGADLCQIARICNSSEVSICLPIRIAWLGRGEGIWAGSGLESRKTTNESQVNQADILNSLALIYYI